MPSLMAALEGPEHTIVAANAAFRSFARQPDLIGWPARQVFPAFPGQQIGDLLDLVYAAGEPFTAREWPTADDRYVDLTLTPWHGDDGAVHGVLLTQVDVTARMRERPAGGQAPALEAASRVRRESVAVQEAMLPSGLPVLPQLRIAARYLPAPGEVVGGAWFDAFSLPGGRVALIVGDTAERGTTASAAMGRLRAMLWQALRLQPDLAAVLEQADGFAAGDAALRAATMCVAVLEPADGRFCYATCGHPPPLVAASDGTARRLPGSGSRPLGVGPGPLWGWSEPSDSAARSGPAAPVGSEILGPGEVLLLYSKGLVERPGRTLDSGLADLGIVAGDAAANPALAAWAAGTPAERVSQLTVELLTRGGYGDDVTTVAGWRQLTRPAPLDVEWPAGPDAAATLRRALDGWLEELGVALGDRQLAELSVTEVVSNAAEHAYRTGRPGPVRLEAAVGGDGYLETRVSDRGRWRVPGSSAAGRGQGLSVAAQFAEELVVSHPLQGAGESPGVRGTVVAMRHRLRRKPMLAPLAVGPAARPADPSFAVELAVPGSAPRIRVAGPVDPTTAGRLESWLLTASLAGVLPLTVDLSAVTILAGAGVRVLYQVAAQLAAHGQNLTLISEPGSPAAAVLDLARLPRSPR
jgi:anti-sigma regulatory factor (Ser/Thr protein kinase)